MKAYVFGLIPSLFAAFAGSILLMTANEASAYDHNRHKRCNVVNIVALKPVDAMYAFCPNEAGYVSHKAKNLVQVSRYEFRMDSTLACMIGAMRNGEFVEATITKPSCEAGPGYSGVKVLDYDSSDYFTIGVKQVIPASETATGIDTVLLY